MAPIAGEPDLALKVATELSTITPNFIIITGTHRPRTIEELPYAPGMIVRVEIIPGVAARQTLFTLRKISRDDRIVTIPLFKQLPAIRPNLRQGV
jgi:hypothetical protein